MIKDFFANARGTTVDEIRPLTEKYIAFFSSMHEYELFCIYCTDMIDLVLMSFEVNEENFDINKIIDLTYCMWKFHASPHIRMSNSLLVRITDMMAGGNDTDSADNDSDESNDEKSAEMAEINDIVVDGMRIKKENN